MINEAGVTFVSYELHYIVFWDAGFISGHFSKIVITKDYLLLQQVWLFMPQADKFSQNPQYDQWTPLSVVLRL